MGAWAIDYVAAWAGEWGLIVHSTAQYRNPAFTGDTTFISGRVVDTAIHRRRGHRVTIEVEMRNQADAVLATASVEVELPSETSST
jgi:acyl-CoA thioesterase FadM